MQMFISIGVNQLNKNALFLKWTEHAQYYKGGRNLHVRECMGGGGCTLSSMQLSTACFVTQTYDFLVNCYW